MKIKRKKNETESKRGVEQKYKGKMRRRKKKNYINDH